MAVQNWLNYTHPCCCRCTPQHGCWTFQPSVDSSVHHHLCQALPNVRRTWCTSTPRQPSASSSCTWWPSRQAGELRQGWWHNRKTESKCCQTGPHTSSPRTTCISSTWCPHLAITNKNSLKSLINTYRITFKVKKNTAKRTRPSRVQTCS